MSETGEFDDRKKGVLASSALQGFLYAHYLHMLRAPKMQARTFDGCSVTFIIIRFRMRTETVVVVT